MREIKFRAWDTQYKQWVIPYDITILGDGTVVADRRGDYTGDIIDTIERPTLVVEQFTGLHDKNGKEIYEGDILQNNAGGYAPVMYRLGGFFVELVDCEEFGTMYVPLNEAILLANLVGNIHDYPELING